MEILQVNGIIRDVLLNIAPLAKQNRTTVKTELSAALPALNADGGQLYQVFLNLALNAIQAMPSGGALTIATRESAYEGKRMAAISFSDTGVGISRENLRRIFEPFFSTRKGGTGLGMSISHRIVRDHGGRIDVTSVPGHGTTITVLLPVSDADSTTSPSETG
jgi:signal transduction histidine kinase